MSPKPPSLEDGDSVSSAETDEKKQVTAEAAPPSASLMGKRILLGLFLGLLVLAGMVLWGDVQEIQKALENFNPWLIPAACGLSFTNYLVRFPRWERYRKLVGVEIDRRTSFLIYLAGLSLTVTPGKMGEAFKSWMLKEVSGAPIAQTAPIVVAERFTDLLAFLVLLSVGGLASAPEYAYVFWAALALCAVLLTLFCSARFAEFCCGILERMPVVGKAADPARAAFASTRVLLSPRELPLATLLATLGWGLECLGFWLLASSMIEGDLPLLFAIYTFAVSAVAGAIVIIAPGGVGPTEGLMISLLSKRYTALGATEAAANGMAASVTILIRLCTLWFAMGLGLVSLALFRRSRRASGS